MLGLRLYRLALYLYPAFHRERFGDEMIEVFRELQAEAAAKGRFAWSLFCAGEIAGVVAGALREPRAVPLEGREFVFHHFISPCLA